MGRFVESILPGAAVGTAAGSTMYILFEAASKAGITVNPLLGFVIGFGSAVAVAWVEAAKNKQ